MELPIADVEWLDTTLRLGAAAILGGLLGLEREIKGKPLGLRTNMLVSLGAASFGLMAMEMIELFEASGTEKTVSLDPAKVIEGIAGGIGFLGTGAIIQARGGVVGATTGATIWVVGAIGLSCGFGLYLHATILTVIAVVVLALLGAVERRLQGGSDGPEDS